MVPLPAETAWMHDALCRGQDPDLFFPERGVPTTEAKAICARCPVRYDCREYAIEHRIPNGIWGGLSGRDRKKVLLERRRLSRLL
jgi:WhiB family redox-sensing transcriptional regulator